VKIQETNPGNYSYSRLLEAIAGADSEINLSQNPELPALIAKTMKWPVVCLLFLIDEKPVGWFAALNTGKEWFSLPHYNNGAFWFDKQSTESWLEKHQVSVPVDESWFFNHFVNREKHFQKIQSTNNLIVITLEPNDFNVIMQPGLTDFRLRHRSYLPLSVRRLDHKTDSLLHLEKSNEAQMNAFPTGISYKIRKALRNGVTTRVGGKELLDDFYQVYRQNIYHLGSFGLPKHFFEVLMQNYSGGMAQIVIADYHGKPVGSAILLTWLQYSENPWFASHRSHNHFYTSYLLHWEMMKSAIGAGCRIYSFGYSTKGSGVHRFKQQWGTTDRTIFLNSNHPIADQLGKMQYLRRIIRKLPLAFSKLFDNYIATKFY
jgi:hypothetical protein